VPKSIIVALLIFTYANNNLCYYRFLTFSIIAVPYLSAFFEATRTEYYRQLYTVSSSGTWQKWLSYFLNGVALQSLDALSRAERINTLLNDWQIQVTSKNSGVIQDIIKQFAVNPYCTTTKVAERLNIAFTTAQRTIEKLENLGIISQTSAGKRNRVYCATQILSILEEPTIIAQHAPQIS
jgi:Fic family protein